ncbi:MAG: PBP1A family penicillin-binding protein [Microgenomates group bacterium]|nr:PBP1A family penicillin-binding protein [Candidatus Woesebacteria bacterium]QQR63531.1 MAG: PBP1A family penicillin-binding protein [Candidatus Roizmanbacteria bacterium]
MKLTYYILFGLINFFILIGDVTRYILVAPFKFLNFLGRYCVRAWQAILRTIHSPKLPNFSIKVPHFRFASFLIFTKKKKTFTKLKKKIVRRSIAGEQIPFLKLRFFLIGFLTAGILTMFYQSYLLVKSLPSPRSIGKVNYPLSTHIYDRNGKILYEFYRDQNRTPVKLKELKPYVYQASIAIEDKDFFTHNGVSPIGGIARAFKEFVLTKQVQGGSTITQQLVKTALLSPDRTIERKIKEMILALWTERLYGKDKILEMYLNQVAYGGSAYGIEEASKAYFGKSAKDLKLSEAALLAGLPQAPSIYSPFSNPKFAFERRNEVLKKMLEQSYITKEQYNAAEQESLPNFSSTTSIHAPHFVFYVKGELEKKFGIRTVEEGGLRVNTSLDLSIQDEVQNILQEEIAKVAGLNVTNGAVIVTRPSTGEIIAMVGSIDYFNSPNGAFNVTTALRQPGSSIKPLMYSLALEKGMTAATTIDDSPVVFRISDTESYSPVNYDGRFHGRVTLRSALANSYNIPAVKTLNQLGVNSFIEHARQLGISTWIDSSQYGLSLTLGGGEVTMLDMARSYGTFANLGYRVDLDPINSVLSLDSDKLYEHEPKKRPVLSSASAYVITDILSDNVARQSAFGPNSQLEIPGYKVAVKTGTTDSKKDNWTIGYTPEFLVSVWVGNNNNSPMNPALASGVTGAAPIWNRVMSMLLKNYSTQNTWFNKPESVVSKPCIGGKVEYFMAGTENSVNCRIPASPTPTP